MSTTPAQQRAIDTHYPLVLAMAGPGSGKTQTTVSRIERWVKDGTSPKGMVVITFTNEAAREMQKRLATVLSPLPQFGFMGTVHGFALRELQRHGHVLGYGPRITVLDAEQAEEMLGTIATRMACKTPLKTLQQMRAEWHQRPRGARFTKPAEIVVATYLRELRIGSAVDFDSILSDFLELLRTPNYTAKWSHLIVDEFQDSAAMDAEIYATMNAEHRFYVGDPDQAIYGFRGGCLDNILRMSINPDVERHVLEGNFRCAPAICTAANNLIGNNVSRFPKRTVSARTGVVGVVDVRAFDIDHAERHWVLSNIAGRIRDGQSPNEIAVLARSNAIVKAFTTDAEALGIPTRKKAPDTKPKDWAIARAAVELLNDPWSAISQRQFVRVKFGAERFAEIQREAAANCLATLHSFIEGFEPADTPPDAVGVRLARLGVGVEAIELVQAALDEMPEPTLAELVFTLARDLQAREEFGHGVTFTTIHSAKGREWGTVYLVAFEQEICPGTAKTRDIEEERRLAFVGITRAKDALVITTANSRQQAFGRKLQAATTPSQFIRESSAE